MVFLIVCSGDKILSLVLFSVVCSIISAEVDCGRLWQYFTEVILLFTQRTVVSCRVNKEISATKGRIIHCFIITHYLFC